jgi:hypothetical protein
MVWYSVSVDGIVCHNETWDHVFEVDGKRDEVYVHHAVHFVDPSGVVAHGGVISDRSKVLGDTNGFPYRIKAGSASSRGGIRTGDSIDYRAVLWQGDIPAGWGVAVTPTLWEWDGGTDLFNSWGQLVVTHGPAIAKAVKKVVTADAPTPADAIISGVSEGLPSLFIALQGILGQAKDRPIGIQNQSFTARTIVLTEKTAKLLSDHSYGERGAGVVPLNFKDEANLAGDYTLYVRVEGLDLFDGLLAREQSSAPVYVMYGGAKFWIPSPEWLARYGSWSDVRVVPAGALKAVPTIPRDGTVLREWSSAPVYVMQGGKRCWIPSPQRLFDLGYNWSSVRVVPDGGLSSIPVGPNA